MTNPAPPSTTWIPAAEIERLKQIAKAVRQEDYALASGLAVVYCHPQPSATDERHLRSLLAEAADVLEAYIEQGGSSEYAADPEGWAFVSHLRLALATPQPAEPEEAELSYEQICEILGKKHVEALLSPERCHDIEQFAEASKSWTGLSNHQEVVAAYRALARILREREANEPECNHAYDVPCGPECDLPSAAVSPSPPESGAKTENLTTTEALSPCALCRQPISIHEKRYWDIPVLGHGPFCWRCIQAHQFGDEPDLLDQMERDAKSRPSSETLACESAAAWQAMDSLMERLRHQIEKLSNGIDAAIALAKRHGADIHEFICTYCDGKAGNYDCEFCHGDGKYYARVVSEEQP